MFFLLLAEITILSRCQFNRCFKKTKQFPFSCQTHQQTVFWLTNNYFDKISFTFKLSSTGSLLNEFFHPKIRRRNEYVIETWKVNVKIPSSTLATAAATNKVRSKTIFILWKIRINWILGLDKASNKLCCQIFVSTSQHLDVLSDLIALRYWHMLVKID